MSVNNLISHKQELEISTTKTKTEDDMLYFASNNVINTNYNDKKEL